MTLVDTSVRVLVEKKRLQALDAVADLLASGRLTVSTVTCQRPVTGRLGGRRARRLERARRRSLPSRGSGRFSQQRALR